MFKLNHPEKSSLFNFYPPLEVGFRGILSIPHSGEVIPSEFYPFLSGNPLAYREDVDFKVNELVDIQALQKRGIAVLVSNIHRICVDLNRSEEHSVMFWKKNTQGLDLVIKDANPNEIKKFIDSYHRPYFEILKALILELEKQKSGLVSVIDLHSMPSRPTDYHLKQNPNQKSTRPDFCLSDRKGKTCSPAFIDFFKNHLSQRGYEIGINDPYIGGFITEFIDRFRTNNIQIEINRSLYMNELSKKITVEKVTILKPLLTDILISGFEEFDS